MALPLLLLALYLHPPDLTLPEIPPPLSAMDRFPSYEMCNNQLTFLAARRAWLDAQRGLFADPMYAPWFEAATDDVEARRLPWDALCDAHYWALALRGGGKWSSREGEGREADPAACEEIARYKLARLRRLIGERAFSAGQMPGLISVEFWVRAD